MGTNHMVTSMDAEKAFDEVQHLLVMQAQEKLGIGRMYLNTMMTRK